MDPENRGPDPAAGLERQQTTLGSGTREMVLWLTLEEVPRRFDVLDVELSSIRRWRKDIADIPGAIGQGDWRSTQGREHISNLGRKEEKESPSTVSPMLPGVSLCGFPWRKSSVLLSLDS